MRHFPPHFAEHAFQPLAKLELELPAIAWSLFERPATVAGIDAPIAFGRHHRPRSGTSFATIGHPLTLTISAGARGRRLRSNRRPAVCARLALQFLPQLFEFSAQRFQLALLFGKPALPFPIACRRLLRLLLGLQRSPLSTAALRLQLLLLLQLPAQPFEMLAQFVGSRHLWGRPGITARTRIGLLRPSAGLR